MSDVNTNQPNAGRIYDYLLGGSHNFEADRQAAEHLLRAMPSARESARLNRWFMYDVVQRMQDAGFDCFLDLATGLPTEGYIHDLVPQATVLYNDADPVTVAYGRQIVGDNPNVRYVQARVEEIDVLLAAADEHFNGQRRVGIVFVGVSYFIDDENLKRVLHRLYDWCAPGSLLGMSWAKMDSAPTGELSQVDELYKRMNSQGYWRSLDQIHEFLRQWQILEPGLISLPEWHEMQSGQQTQDEFRQAGGNLYGVIVQKPE